MINACNYASPLYFKTFISCAKEINSFNTTCARDTNRTLKKKHEFKRRTMQMADFAPKTSTIWRPK